LNSINSIKSIKIDNPDRSYEVILIQANFTIFTIDDLFMRLQAGLPGIEIAIAMNESEPEVTRVVGTSETLRALAGNTMLSIGASHAAIIFLKGAYPIQALPIIKNHPCVCHVFGASSNELEVIIIETSLGRSIIGIVDGYSANHIESQDEQEKRKSLVRQLGYFSE
jgi:adenosine/AMP kinase